MNLVDVVNEIEKKMNDLEKRKEREIEKIKEKYDEEISQLKHALLVNKDMNTTCLKCRGSGSSSQMDAAGDTERIKCPRCNGTGTEPK